MSKQFRRTFSKMILRRNKRTNELSGVSKFKANRKQKKKNPPIKNKLPDKKSTNNDAKQRDSSDSKEKSSSVFVTSKC